MRLSAASSLNLVILCIAFSNTVQMQKVIRQLIKEGMKISKEDAGFLSPYPFGHLNFYGQFNFQPVPEFDSQFVEKESQQLEGTFLANCLPKGLRFLYRAKKHHCPLTPNQRRHIPCHECGTVQMPPFHANRMRRTR